MARPSSSTTGKGKKVSKSQGGNKMKKNAKKAIILGPMDFFVKRTGTSSSSASSSPPPSASTSSPPSPTASSSTTTTTSAATSLPISSSTRSKTFRTRHANVCGETDLSDVTSIVREWVETEIELIDEDVAYILKFFYDLIEERNFIFLASVIQDFYSAVGSRDDHQWKEAYNNVVISIQSDLRSDPSLPQDIILPTFDV